ncbi:hypothetical protein PENSPDRAFT_504967 [Peniophora sp. CONT]|nr:hypothetical protein PENSPDRAFT_504967 [Peniophora sp. CONT]
MRWTALRFRRRVIDPDTSNEPAISVDPDCPVDRAPDVSSLWIAAIKQYHRSLDVDLQDPSLSFIDSLRYCSTAEEILDVLQSTSSCLHNKRQGSKTSRTLRDVLKPVVYGLLAILDVGAEAASSTGVPGGKSIFAAIAVLLKAADSVRAAYDDLEKLFERLEAYVKRLQVRLQAPMRSGAREVAVTSLVEMLKALALATKMVRRNRVELFLRALFTRSSEVRAAIQDLEVLVSDEEKMAVTDVVVDVSGSTTETVQAMVDEIRENERQRSSDKSRKTKLYLHC